MTYISEMSPKERKELSKEQLSYLLNREEERACYSLHHKFIPISDEKLEKVYNNIQNEPDDEFEGCLLDNEEIKAIIDEIPELKLKIEELLYEEQGKYYS